MNGRGDLGKIRKGLQAGLPSFGIPRIDISDSAAMKAIVILALTLASIGLIESLMTLSLIDEELIPTFRVVGYDSGNLIILTQDRLDSYDECVQPLVLGTKRDIFQTQNNQSSQEHFSQ